MAEPEKRCGHCGIVIWTTHDSDHPGLCCDCFDLKQGMPLVTLNAEPDKNRRAPITKREDSSDSSSSR